MFFNCHAHESRKDSVVIVNGSISNIELVDYYSIGIHPWEAVLHTEDNFLKIQQIAAKKNCLAIGEIGLDKLKGGTIEFQTKIFTTYVLLAEQLKLPVILHCVKAWNEVAALKQKIAPKQTWIYHGFSKATILQNVLDMGLMVSIGSMILTSESLQNVLPQIPDNRLLLETDDAPNNIFEIYKKVSEIKQIPLQTLEQIIEDNFKRTFTKWQSGLNEQNY